MPITVRLRARATPRARLSDLRRQGAGSLAAHTAAPPTHGRAHRARIDLLAKALNLRRREISINRGAQVLEERMAVTTDDPPGTGVALASLEIDS
ncbi:MAG: DUF167 domain-containing protein [Chloroflexota bacterium]|nr:DUF167 domain-containing protein [Chloroflexota bacterium]MDE2920467.1 DUF167 domain-containing protein [Chloroflexota bacterium]